MFLPLYTVPFTSGTTLADNSLYAIHTHSGSGTGWMIDNQGRLTNAITTSQEDDFLYFVHNVGKYFKFEMAVSGLQQINGVPMASGKTVTLSYLTTSRDGVIDQNALQTIFTIQGSGINIRELYNGSPNASASYTIANPWTNANGFYATTISMAVSGGSIPRFTIGNTTVSGVYLKTQKSNDSTKILDNNTYWGVIRIVLPASSGSSIFFDNFRLSKWIEADSVSTQNKLVITANGLRDTTGGVFASPGIQGDTAITRAIGQIENKLNSYNVNGKLQLGGVNNDTTPTIADYVTIGERRTHERNSSTRTDGLTVYQKMKKILDYKSGKKLNYRQSTSSFRINGQQGENLNNINFQFGSNSIATQENHLLGGSDAYLTAPAESGIGN